MLNDDITRYLELHRTLGFKYKKQANLLRSFASFAQEHGQNTVISETALAWVARAPSPAQRRERLLTLRRFALQLRVENDECEIPPVEAFGKQQRERRLPHIYTREELSRMLKGASKMTPKGSIRPLTYVTLLALLASTGLRISEALNLNLDDITNDGLLIRETKFRKTRQVPIHPTAQQGIERFMAAREKAGAQDNSLFISLWGTRLSYSTVYPSFLALLRSIGLRAGPGYPGPVLHDIRHTFAVRSLEACVGSEEHVSRHVLALSTYLGHAHPSDTYWYLQATPSLLAGIARAGESLYHGGAI